MERTRFAVAFLTAFASACAGQSPVAPTSLTGMSSPAGLSDGPSASSGALSGRNLAVSSYGGHGFKLSEEPGSVPAGGTGILNDTQTGEPGFNNFELTVSVHGGPPNADLYFQFVGDIFPGTRGDGVCPAPFPNPPANTIGILHTSAGGAASGHFKFEVPEGAALGAFDSGVKSDFKWRVVNLAQTFDLRTPCIVLTGK